MQHRDGRWYPGQLEAYRKVGGISKGYVRYSTGFAETRPGSFEEGDWLRDALAAMPGTRVG